MKNVLMIVAVVLAVIAFVFLGSATAQRGAVKIFPVIPQQNLPYGTVVGFACTASQCYVAIQ